MTNATETKVAMLEQKLAKGFEASVLEDLLFVFGETAKLRRDPRRAKYVLMLVENEPRSSLHRTPLIQLNPSEHPAERARAKQLWERHVAEQPDCPHIAVRAALFFYPSSLKRAREILLEFEARTSGEPEIYLTLGQCSEGSEQIDFFERAVSAGSEQTNLPVWIVATAMDISDFERIERYGLWLLAEAGDPTEPPTDRMELAEHQHYSHWGHTALGVLALHLGDIDAAAIRLAQSLDEGHEFRMSSYGPSLHLAKRLCEAKYWLSVASYLRRVDQFWGIESVANWIRDVEQERMPDFIVKWPDDV